MTEIKNFAAANKILQRFISESHSQLHGYKLDQMIELMDFLGNPQNSYKVIHVAGTSGKTSTCYYLSSFFKAAGKKVGLTVSPHIDQINERVQINLEPLAEKQYCNELSIFIDIVKGSGISPTYFELLVAFAYWEFARQQVDYAVVEVGMGGLLDGTNVVTRQDKICVITDIGLDHVEILGETKAKIAIQKAGIILTGSHVFSYKHDNEVSDVIRKISSQKKAVFHEIKLPTMDKLPNTLPFFQKRNWYLAQQVYNFISKEDKLGEFTAKEQKSTTETHIPARMEIIKYKNRTVILDGAHNSQKISALTRSIKQLFPNKKIVIVTGFVNTKQANMDSNLQLLTRTASYIILTSFAAVSQERFSIDPSKLADICDQLGYSNWQIIENPLRAIETAVLRDEPIILITGSFYLLNHIRPVVLEKH